MIRHRLSPGVFSHCLLDFLCGVELCVCGLELGTVLDIYDVPVYALLLWIVIVWQVRTVDGRPRIYVSIYMCPVSILG